MKSAEILGMMAEVLMKAKLLRQKLKKNPNLLVEILNSMDSLEDEMVFYFKKMK